MELIYRNAKGENVTLRQVKPLFLSKLDGVGSVRQTINTFHAPEQDGAFYIFYIGYAQYHNGGEHPCG